MKRNTGQPKNELITHTKTEETLYLISGPS